MFTVSWQALRETIEGEQGFQAAALMVLHTWSQKLQSHGRVHAVVPAGGPSLVNPDRWKATMRHGRDNPFSSERLVSADEGHVKFWVREGRINSGDRQRKSVPLRLSGVEFVRRWSLHILPKGYVRCRRYGSWSNRQRASFVANCGQLLGNDPVETPANPSADDDLADRPRCCCECGQPMRLIAETQKPSWSIVMSATNRPDWYRGSG